MAYLFDLLYVAGGAAASMKHCPECGRRMRRIRRKPPQKPYYMDYAHRCWHCDIEVEAGHILDRPKSVNESPKQ